VSQTPDKDLVVKVLPNVPAYGVTQHKVEIVQGRHMQALQITSAIEKTASGWTLAILALKPSGFN
jgi:hypothetical protein